MIGLKLGSLLNLLNRTQCPIRHLHVTPSLSGGFEGPKKWLDYNKVVYPPQEPNEERRPAVK